MNLTAWGFAINKSTLARAERSVLRVLLDYASCNADGLAWPTVARLARDTLTSERTVRRALAELRRRGVLAVARRGGGRALGGGGAPTHYQLPKQPPKAALGTREEASERRETERALQRRSEDTRRRLANPATRRSNPATSSTPNPATRDAHLIFSKDQILLGQPRKAEAPPDLGGWSLGSAVGSWLAAVGGSP